MPTSHYKIKPKDLRQPDEFVTLVDRAGNYLANNLMRVILGAVGVIVLAAMVFTYAFYRAHQNRVCADRFYTALTALNHKDYKTAEEGFESLAQQGGGKLASLAPLYVASAYMSESKPAQARDALEAYVADNSQRYFKNIALVQLGVAYEDLGDFKKAHAAYAQAAALPGPERTSADLGVARTLLKLGDTPGAIAAYRKFLSENPYSAERTDVVESLAALGAGPSAGQSPNVSAAEPPKSKPTPRAAAPASQPH